MFNNGAIWLGVAEGIVVVNYPGVKYIDVLNTINK